MEGDDEGIFLFAASKSRTIVVAEEIQEDRKEEEVKEEVKEWAAVPRRRPSQAATKEDLARALITTETLLKFSTLYTPKEADIQIKLDRKRRGKPVRRRPRTRKQRRLRAVKMQ